MRSRLLAGVVAALVVGGRLTAQAPVHAPPPAASPTLPTLSEIQRLTLTIRVLAQRNAALELELVVRELARPGYTLDLQTLAYVPILEK